MGDVLTTVGQFSVVVPLSVGLIRWRRLPVPGRWLVALLLLWLGAEIAFDMLSIFGLKNLWLSYFLSIGEFLIFLGVFKRLLPDVPVRWVIYAGIALVVAEFFWGNRFNSISLIYESASIIVFGVLLFREMIEGRASWNYTWIIAGLMALFIGSSVYYSSYLHPDDLSTLTLLSKSHSVLLIIVYSILTVGICKLERQTSID